MYSCLIYGSWCASDVLATTRPRAGALARLAVDHDRVVRRLYDVALDAEHQPILSVEEPRLQPLSDLIEKRFRHGREELQRVEECTLLLDDTVDRGAADFDSSTLHLRVSPARALTTGARHIGLFQPMRQISLSRIRFQHDRATRQRIHAIGKRQRLPDQLLDQ